MILIRRHLLPKRRKLDILVCLFSQRYNMGRRTNQPDFLQEVALYTGGGIPNLYRIWKSEGWPEPVFTESCSPDRVSLTLYMTSRSNDGENAAAGKQVPLSALSQRQLLIDYLTDHPTSDLFALSKSLGTSLSRTESLLQQLADEGIVVVEAGQGNRLYKLKA